MIPKVLRNKSFCPYSLLLDYIDRGTFLTKLSDSTQLSISLNKPYKGVISSSLTKMDEGHIAIQSNLDCPDFSIIRTFSLVPFFS